MSIDRSHLPKPVALRELDGPEAKSDFDKWALREINALKRDVPASTPTSFTENLFPLSNVAGQPALTGLELPIGHPNTTGALGDSKFGADAFCFEIYPGNVNPAPVLASNATLAGQANDMVYLEDLHLDLATVASARGTAPSWPLPDKTGCRVVLIEVDTDKSAYGVTPSSAPAVSDFFQEWHQGSGIADGAAMPMSTIGGVNPYSQGQWCDDRLYKSQFRPSFDRDLQMLLGIEPIAAVDQSIAGFPVPVSLQNRMGNGASLTSYGAMKTHDTDPSRFHFRVLADVEVKARKKVKLLGPADFARTLAVDPDPDIPTRLDNTYFLPEVTGINEEMRLTVRRWYLRRWLTPVGGNPDAATPSHFCPQRLFLYLIPNWSSVLNYADSSLPLTPVYRWTTTNYPVTPRRFKTFQMIQNVFPGPASVARDVAFPTHVLTKLQMRQTYVADTNTDYEPERIPAARVGGRVGAAGAPNAERAMRQHDMDLGGHRYGGPQHHADAQPRMEGYWPSKKRKRS